MQNDYNPIERVLETFPIDEIKRKAFHMLTLIYVLGYWLLPKQVVIYGMSFVIIGVMITEAIRLNNRIFNDWLLNFLGGVHREEETNKVSGLVWTMSGSFLTILLFPDKPIVIVSLLYLSFGDSLAALIGKNRGKFKIWNKKTLEGSFACFLACLFVGFFFLPWQFAIFGAVVATLIETIPWPLNDNFWMPLISAAVLTHFIALI